MPNPKLSKIAIVENENEELVGFFCLQLRVHAEPMFIKEEYRHKGVWTKLVEMILPQTENTKVYVIASTPQTEEMVKRLGLRWVNSPLYCKDIK